MATTANVKPVPMPKLPTVVEACDMLAAVLAVAAPIAEAIMGDKPEAKRSQVKHGLLWVAAGLKLFAAVRSGKKVEGNNKK